LGKYDDNAPAAKLPKKVKDRTFKNYECQWGVGMVWVVWAASEFNSKTKMNAKMGQKMTNFAKARVRFKFSKKKIKKIIFEDILDLISSSFSENEPKMATMNDPNINY
jgi:hypothetical protein